MKKTLCILIFSLLQLEACAGATKSIHVQDPIVPSAFVYGAKSAPTQVEPEAKPESLVATNLSLNFNPLPGKPIPPSETILEYMVRFNEMSVDGQRKELAQVHEKLVLNKYDFNYRMKAAVIYALPSSRFRDPSKAQALLDDLVREKALDSRYKVMAIMLRDYLNETTKLIQENSKLLQENNKLLQENNKNVLKAREEQKRADTLQQMLDELKSIEKNMVDREPAVRK
ncbi:MAG TPA: hypothetical protein VFF74_02030 [Methylophilaceae bacterium]|nr:hypothetical protein [Methylophilaceae bacterium]